METEREETIRKAYDRAAQAYASGLFYELYDKPLDVKLLDLFAERVDPNGTVLEVGCGPGEVGAYLQYKGIRTIGIDISPAMIEEAKRMNPRGDFHIGSVFSLPFPDSCCSGVLAPFLIVNFTDEEISPAFIEIARVLRPSGLFYCSFHVGHDVIHVDDFLVPGNPLDFRCHETEKIAALMESSGFEVVEFVTRSPYREKEYPSTRAYFFARRRP